MDESVGEQLRRRIGNPKNFYGGLVLMGLALLAMWGVRALAGSHGVHFGPGTAPRLFSGMLFMVGAAVAVTGLVSKDRPPIERFGLRGPVFVTASILFFAAAIPAFGLLATSFATILIASVASPKTRWLEAICWAAVLSLFCTLIFVVLLGLPLPLWPKL
jgi:putative tricarboxylic transport membrane protein